MAQTVLTLFNALSDTQLYINYKCKANSSHALKLAPNHEDSDQFSSALIED
jgi:hypothetical protein